MPLLVSRSPQVCVAGSPTHPFPFKALQALHLPGGLLADQRKAMPVSALPEGWQSTGRNQPCPCGSGAKFKHCHGALI